MEIMVRIRGKNWNGETIYGEQYIDAKDLYRGLNEIIMAELQDDRAELWITDVSDVVLDLITTHQFATIDEIKLYA